MEVLIGAIAVIFIFALMFGLFIIPIAYINTWATWHLWTWFVTPVFGVATPSMPLIYGLMLVLFMFIPNKVKSLKTTGKDVVWKEFWSVMVNAISTPLFIVGLGWIVHTYFV